MKYKNRGKQPLNPVTSVIVPLALLAAVLMAPSAMALGLTVTGVTNTSPLNEPATTTTVDNYRWLIEEDKTYHVPLNPDGTVQLDGTGAPVVDPNWRPGLDGIAGTIDDPVDRNTVSVNFHHSYMPVVATGSNLDAFPAACPPAVVGDPCLDSNKNYFISVLAEGYSMGGAPIKAGQAAVEVLVNKNPIPTAQVTIFVHEDIAPINNVWDLGETGLEGFAIILEDAGGKYGISAGIQSQDAFGNLLCTTY